MHALSLAVASALLVLTHIVPSVSAWRYTQRENLVGRDFFRAFEHQAIPDPTHGRVNYVDESTARRLNLSYATRGRDGDAFVIRAQAKGVLNPDGPGRNSVRIRSRKLYETHVAVFDIRHMPTGCATWPAVWEVLEADWPNSGEVDIVEGVNGVGPNHATLHTSEGCTIPRTGPQTGKVISRDCNVAVNFNQGCSIEASLSNSYGTPFNRNRGGWYAIERTDEFMKVWFWPRNSKSVPREVKKGDRRIDTKTWSKPFASFVNDACNFKEKFGKHNIIINLTLCGDWAGNPDVYAASGCSGSCVDLVNNHPEAFREAYWEFGSLRIYT